MLILGHGDPSDIRSGRGAGNSVQGQPARPEGGQTRLLAIAHACFNDDFAIPRQVVDHSPVQIEARSGFVGRTPTHQAPHRMVFRELDVAIGHCCRIAERHERPGLSLPAATDCLNAVENTEQCTHVVAPARTERAEASTINERPLQRIISVQTHHSVSNLFGVRGIYEERDIAELFIDSGCA